MLSVPNGEIIIERGTRAKGLYLILKGKVYFTLKTLEHSFMKLNRGGYFGDIIFLDRKSSINII
jgi:CRP-like cAMP-binding protein